MRKPLPTLLHKWAAVAAILVLAAALFLCAALPAVAFTGCSVEDAPLINADFEARVAELVNAERTSRGLPPLKLVASLSAAARYHAADMGSDDYFEHDSYDRVSGSLKHVCGAFDRVSLWYDDWSAVAENIGGGYTSPEAVVAGWMNSAGHRSNILSDKFQELGVGYFAGAGELDSYWVQDFGARFDAAPLVLASEAISTTDQDLDVYIYGDWQEMRLRNDGGAWSNWRPFADNFTWTIDDGGGQHVVTAELRNAGGVIVSTCDTILLDTVVQSAPAAGSFKLFLPNIQSGPSVACE